MNTPPQPENPVLHENAVDHCKQLRVQATIRSITDIWPELWNMPHDVAMRHFKTTAITGCTLAYLRRATESVLKQIEQGDLVTIQSFSEANPGKTIEEYKEFLRYVLENFDEADAEAMKQLETITHEEIMAIMGVSTNDNMT